MNKHRTEYTFVKQAKQYLEYYNASEDEKPFYYLKYQSVIDLIEQGDATILWFEYINNIGPDHDVWDLPDANLEDISFMWHDDYDIVLDEEGKVHMREDLYKYTEQCYDQAELDDGWLL